MSKRITVVLSQGQSANPVKRKLEEEIVGSLLGEPGIEVTIVPHLYDLAPNSTGMICLAGISGDMILCSWLYPRAAHWTLDRNAIVGRFGKTLIRAYGEEEDEENPAAEEAGEDSKEGEPGHGKPRDEEKSDSKDRVVDHRSVPSRTIYCLDLRTEPAAETYLEEIRRIAREATVETIQLGGFGQLENSDQPGNFGQIDSRPNASEPDANEPAEEASKSGSHSRESSPNLIPSLAPFDSTNGFATPSGPIKLSSEAPLPEDSANAPARRWYPVIDFSRCTNCMECIDFCLFGVYGLDGAETILVEQPDNCRKGCPACSRVCPENAIIFPQHKTPTIAGSPEVGGPMKIDLSKLFGAPDPGAPGAGKALDVAVRERDEQLLIAGREIVGQEVGLPKRQAPASGSEHPKDELDSLMDELDGIDF